MGNILLSEDGSAAVIDWTFAGVRDRRFDLAWMLLLTALDPASPLYGTLLATYEDITGAVIEDLPYFEAWAVGRRLLLLLMILTAGGAQFGMRPGLEDALKHLENEIPALRRRLYDLTGVVLPAAKQFG